MKKHVGSERLWGAYCVCRSRGEFDYPPAQAITSGCSRRRSHGPGAKSDLLKFMVGRSLAAWPVPGGLW